MPSTTTTDAAAAAAYVKNKTFMEYEAWNVYSYKLAFALNSMEIEAQQTALFEERITVVVNFNCKLHAFVYTGCCIWSMAFDVE